MRDFLCGKLTTVFLGERDAVKQNSLEVGAYLQRRNGRPRPKLLLEEWVEMWDYAGDLRFRGFVAGGVHMKSLFVFFDKTMVDNDLKSG